MSSEWRMAFMFDARNGDLGALERELVGISPEIRSRAASARVRLGVADRHPDLAAATDTEYDIAHWRMVDAAIELTVAADLAKGLAELAKVMSKLFARLAQPQSIEVMAGPIFAMVEPRAGECFLSLAFRRDGGITRRQFQDWWRFQHSKVAIPVMGPGMLAYDQVHIDNSYSEVLAKVCGITPVLYDAYDNLTWATRQGYLTSISDAKAMAGIFQDEVGHIDNASRRYALMRRVG